MKNYQKIIIGVLLVIMVLLVFSGLYYVIVNNREDDTGNVKTNISSIHAERGIIDSLEQPSLNIKVNLDTLPETKDTLTELKFSEFKKLFQTTKRSILLLTREGCSYCASYLPLFKEALENLEIKAYEIDIAHLSDKDYSSLSNYLNYDGTPTTYIIENGSVTHSLSGYVEKEIIVAFLDMFYLRK